MNLLQAARRTWLGWSALTGCAAGIVCAQNAPPPVLQAQSTEITITNGVRTISVKQGQETIEVKDKDGKNISIRHTHIVDGKSKTDVYEADDLDALKKNHPKGAELYRQVTAPLVMRVMQQARAFAPGALPPKTGDRQIRATLRGQVVEIADQHGHKIRMRVRPRSPKDAPAQEYAAEDLAELRQLSPEVAALYERLAGIPWQAAE